MARPSRAAAVREAIVQLEQLVLEKRVEVEALESERRRLRHRSAALQLLTAHFEALHELSARVAAGRGHGARPEDRGFAAEALEALRAANARSAAAAVQGPAPAPAPPAALSWTVDGAEAVVRAGGVASTLGKVAVRLLAYIAEAVPLVLRVRFGAPDAPRASERLRKAVRNINDFAAAMLAAGPPGIGPRSCVGLPLASLDGGAEAQAAAMAGLPVEWGPAGAADSDAEGGTASGSSASEPSSNSSGGGGGGGGGGGLGARGRPRTTRYRWAVEQLRLDADQEGVLLVVLDQWHASTSRLIRRRDAALAALRAARHGGAGAPALNLGAAGDAGGCDPEELAEEAESLGLLLALYSQCYFLAATSAVTPEQHALFAMSCLPRFPTIAALDEGLRAMIAARGAAAAAGASSGGGGGACLEGRGGGGGGDGGGSNDDGGGGSGHGCSGGTRGTGSGSAATKQADLAAGGGGGGSC